MLYRPAVLATIVALVLSGCAAQAPREVQPPPTSSPTISDAVATPPPTATPSALPVLGSRETSHNGTPLVIAVNSLHSTKGSTTLNFTITNRGSKPWQYWTAMSGGLAGRDNMTIKNVFLLDTKHGRRLLPARDADGLCVCSDVGNQDIGAGQSMVLSAVFAPLPDGVDTTAVHIPLAGTFDEVPVSR